jgi:molecular chaperone DnaK (HSP70)
MNARFSVGIDLGTSNSAIAVGDIESGDTKIVEIEQMSRLGTRRQDSKSSRHPAALLALAPAAETQKPSQTYLKFQPRLMC